MNPAGFPDIPVQVPIDDPNADTEWNDILRKHKIIPEKPPSPTPMIEEALSEARRLASENRLEGKDLEELDELEDDEDEEFLALYRRRRMQEMNTLASKAIHSTVYPVAKRDYAREITEASKKFPVLLHLASSSHGNVESRLLSELLRQAARKYPEVKFCEMVASMCIENYPERNCPTILMYKEGDLSKNLIGLGSEMRGIETRLPDLEQWMVRQGVIERGDQRLRSKEDEEEVGGREELRDGGAKSRGQKAGVESDDEDDWD